MKSLKTIVSMLPTTTMALIAIMSMRSDTHANPNEGPGVPYSSINRYCIYALNADSSINTYACYNSKEEADSFEDAMLTWVVVADFNTYNDDNNSFGNVRFLIPDNKPCTTTRNYQIPNLGTPVLNLDNKFVSAKGGAPLPSWSSCSRVRVWEDSTFNGYSLACRSDTGYCDDLVDGTDGALDLTNKVSAWRAIIN
jgi:hypothetical protein